MPRRKKKKQDDPPEGNFDMLFLQLMMIMMAFFILLTSISTIVDEKRVLALGSIAGAFSLFPSGANLDEGDGPSMPNREHGGQNPASKRTAKDLTEIAKLLGMGDAVHVLPLDKNSVRVRLQEKILFQPGRVNLNPETTHFLSLLASLLQKPEIQEITIEGHTDGTPSKSKIYPSNWELSAARAMQVYHAFAGEGIVKTKMVVAGMGDTQPLSASETKGSLALNRRVEIQIRFRPTSSSTTRPVSEGKQQPPELSQANK
ncbi:MAG: OmpA family protein [Mariprofundaceae bacterium]